MFTVDGLQWSIPCDITRSVRIQDSEISGQLMNGHYFHDVEGTFYDYEVKLTPNPYQMADYYSLVEILTQPVEGHAFVFPYNGETVEVTAKVEAPRDIWVRLPNGGVYWQGMSFKATANGPTKQQTLAGAIRRGLTPLPEVSNPQVGDTWTYTADGWQRAEGFADADTTAY